MRELSFTVLLPDSWVRRAGFRTGTFTVAGQNLATWSKYPGIDPDVSSRGINFETVDFLQPGSRRLWVVRANVTL